jgi:hypothetical protein
MELNPRVRLTLVEGFRATWRAVTAVAGSDQGSRERATTVGHPDRPENLLFHGLLAYTAHALPELSLTEPALEGLVSVHTRPGHVVTNVPDDQAAMRIAKLLRPHVGRVTINLLPHCGFGMAEVDHLVHAGVRVVCSAGASSPHAHSARDIKGAL